MKQTVVSSILFLMKQNHNAPAFVRVAYRFRDVFACTASAKFSIPLPSFLKSSRRGLHQTQAPKKGGEKRKEKKRKTKVDARG